VSNVLFVDHPAQVGFSYANPVPGYVDENTGNIITLPNATCPEYALDMGSCGTYSAPNVSNTANTTEGAAPSMWKTLQGFMGAFPQYSTNGVHFATESYGGHYGPIFNEYVRSFEELKALIMLMTRTDTSSPKTLLSIMTPSPTPMKSTSDPS
jgi:carboxypeptidase C (cathepsin A)